MKSAAEKWNTGSTNRKGACRLHNVIFPVWLLVWVPSWLWLFLIPANLLVDGLVLRYAGRKMQVDDPHLIRNNLWKVCLAGFAADFAGSFLLFAALLLAKGNTAQAMGWNPFADIWALLIHIAAIAVSGYLIYLYNKMIFRSLGEEKAHGIAIRMALITAPYLFLLPTTLFY